MVEDDGSPCLPWGAFGGMRSSTLLGSNVRTKAVNKIKYNWEILQKTKKFYADNFDNFQETSRRIADIIDKISEKLSTRKLFNNFCDIIISKYLNKFLNISAKLCSSVLEKY